MRKVFDLRRFLIVIGLTVGVMLLPTPEGLTIEGQKAIALFVFTGAILALEPAPLPISALMVPICQIALGIDVAQGAFAPFGSPVLFLILGSLFLAEALRKHGLTRRMALYIIVASRGNMDKLLFGLMFVTGLLSMWVLNTATAAVLIPVAITIAQRVQPQEKAPRALQLMILGIAFSSSIGGMGTVMGSGENAIAGGLLLQVGDFGFLNWMTYGRPDCVHAAALELVPVDASTADRECRHRHGAGGQGTGAAGRAEGTRARDHRGARRLSRALDHRFDVGDDAEPAQVAVEQCSRRHRRRRPAVD